MFCSDCGLEIDEIAQFCKGCGARVSKQPGPRRPDTHYALTNYGAVVFSAFALISLAISLARGLVPVYLLESACFGALAWYWHKQELATSRSNLVVLLIALVVAGGQGFVLGRHMGPDYTYIQKGGTQLRVDSLARRTDVLTTTGWQPLSFDAQPSELGYSDLVLTHGSWTPGTSGRSPGTICFGVNNRSDRVVKEVDISVEVTPMSGESRQSGGSKDDPYSEFNVNNKVNLTQRWGGLLNSGNNSEFCGPIETSLSAGVEWSYKIISVKGW
jgi:hypothetical protein